MFHDWSPSIHAAIISLVCLFYHHTQRLTHNCSERWVANVFTVASGLFVPL